LEEEGVFLVRSHNREQGILERDKPGAVGAADGVPPGEKESRRGRARREV